MILYQHLKATVHRTRKASFPAANAWRLPLRHVTFDLVSLLSTIWATSIYSRILKIQAHTFCLRHATQAVIFRLISIGLEFSGCLWSSTPGMFLKALSRRAVDPILAKRDRVYCNATDVFVDTSKKRYPPGRCSSLETAGGFLTSLPTFRNTLAGRERVSYHANVIHKFGRQ